MKFVRVIDANGSFIEEMFVEELTENTIETHCPEGFYKPKWTGTKWVEGLTQEDFDEINNKPKILSDEQKRILDLERAITDILGGGV